jgi:ribose-phosphate pyrophosphokinase
MANASFKLFAGSASQSLGRDLAHSLGCPLSKSTHYPLPNGEPYVELNDSVEGADVYIIQSLITPASWHLLELILMADAAKRSGASSIQAIIPYYSYGRQDRVEGPGQPLAAKCVAQLLEASNLTKVITLNAHSPHLSTFFDIPLIELSAVPLLAQTIQALSEGLVTFLAADTGALKLALEYTQLTSTSPPASILKHRENAYQVSAKGLLGEVNGKDVWIVDDCVQTGQTLIQAAYLARQHGARSVSAAVVHMDMSKDALEALKALGLKHLLTTNSCENPFLQELGPTIVSLAPLLKNTINSSLKSIIG